jgi:hypothetical protein
MKPANKEKLLTILKEQSLENALKAFGELPNNKWNNKARRLYAVWCAKQVQHLVLDKRILHALTVAEDFANNKVTFKEIVKQRHLLHDFHYAFFEFNGNANDAASSSVLSTLASHFGCANWSAQNARNAVAYVSFNLAPHDKDAARNAANEMRQRQINHFCEIL